MESDYVSVSSEVGKPGPSTKKRIKTGRVKDVMKHLRVSTHELGPDCECKRYRCYEVVGENDRKRIIREFNAMGTLDSQNVYLCGLITTLPVARRRPRSQESTRACLSSFAYQVRVADVDGNLQNVQVCYKAFLSLHGITPQRVQRLKVALALTGQCPVDMRGKHSNRPRNIPNDTKNFVTDFIKSLKIRRSQSLGESKKFCLPEDLNVKKLHQMYSEKHSQNKISYESFLTIFKTNFNGYPRKDSLTQNVITSVCRPISASPIQKIEFPSTEQFVPMDLNDTSPSNLLQIIENFEKIQDKDFNFCMMLYHEMKLLPSEEKKENLLKYIQRGLVLAYEL